MTSSGTSKRQKTWNDRLNAPVKPELKPCPVNIAGMKPGQIMLIPTPEVIDAFIRKLPAGKSMTTLEMRQALAKEYGAEVTCPITTGFHLRTVAEAAVETAGDRNDWQHVTPFWRVIDEKSPTFRKLSFDTSIIRHQRALEGLG